MNFGTVLIASLSIAGIAGSVYLYNLNKFSNNLEVMITGAIHKVSLHEILLRVNVKMKNPTAATVSIKQPFVRLLDEKGNIVASSQVIDKDIPINKHSEQMLEPVYFQLSLLNLALKIPNLLNEYRTKGKITLIAEITSKVDNRIPITKRQVLTMGYVQ
jgi:hypothetical protein